MPTDNRAMLDELRQKLKSLAEPQKARDLQRFFKTAPGEYGEGDVFLGVKVPQSRKLAREYKDLIPEHIVELLGSKIHEERFLALVILVAQFRKAGEDGRREIYELYCRHTARINNWDLVDTSAEHIVGGYLLERDKAPLRTWARSSSLWERRIGIMATFHFIRQNHFATTLELASMLLDDEHDLIHKAVGWMLREIGKRDFALEEEFLRAHYRKMPRVMLRYAIEKFPEERRKQYLRGEI